VREQISPVDVPRRPRLRNRVGRCYELSGAAALDHHDWALVHGTVRGRDGGPIGHAWIERDGWIYDATTDEAMHVDLFHRKFAAVEQGRWVGEGVAAMVRRHGHWGPWLDENEAPAPGHRHR